MEVHQVDPADPDGCARWARLYSSAIANDAPWHGVMHPQRVSWMASRPGHPPRLQIFRDNGQDVAISQLTTGQWDNRDLALGELMVHPDVRRQGHGSAALGVLEEQARELNCTRMVLDGPDVEATREFSAATGYQVDLVGLARRVRLDQVDWSALASQVQRATEASADYELLRQSGPTPQEYLPGLVEVFNSMRDAPTGEMPLEEDVYSIERLSETERHYSGPENRFWQLIARHRESGELVGHTVVVVNALDPECAEQHETSVKRQHRGHQLGIRLKAEMLQWLQQVEPQLRTITTWNAEPNKHMGQVNDALGFEVMSRWLDVAKSL